MTIELLTAEIEQLDVQLRHAAAKSVNVLLTTRNWLIGFYLVEYEHSGKERAEYGKSLTENLANRLNTKGLSARNLWLFRQFHLAYPQIGQALLDSPQILQSPIALSPKSTELVDNKTNEILHPVGTVLRDSQQWLENLEKLAPLHVPGDRLLAKLSFTHIKALLPLEDPLQRTFYEIESIKGTWSVRELKRQIFSLYFERSGLSTDPETLSQITQKETISTQPQHLAKDIYSFEFLGLPAHLAVEESDLETSLLDHL